MQDNFSVEDASDMMHYVGGILWKGDRISWIFNV
jgi:hypothetical protein